MPIILYAFYKVDLDIITLYDCRVNFVIETDTAQ